MNSLTRIMSYDKTRHANQENCDCVECANVKVENQSLSDEEIEQIIKERYYYKDEKTKTFIWKALKKHGDKYDYSKVIYTKATEKVEIICRVEGHKPFPQTPHSHLQGRGCSMCGGSQKLTLEEFIRKANEIYGEGIYNYSKVKYKNTSTKICIICNNHNEPYEFWQTPNDHLQIHGCPICGGTKKLTLEEFIKRANKIHGLGRYDYSKVNYVNNNTKIIIICNNHNEPYEFKQTPHNHLINQGCPLCSGKQKLTLKEFIKRAIEIYGNKYDYSEVVYKNMQTKICIICKNHKESYRFWQTPHNHLNGEGCNLCSIENIKSKDLKKRIHNFIRKSKNKYHNLYDYSLVKENYTNQHNKVTIICNTCGLKFNITPSAHLKGEGCSYCNMSKGEVATMIYLENNNIEYIRQYKFKDCKDKRALPFDFYLPQYNLCIEYDGKGHFQKVDYYGKLADDKLQENYEYVKKHDKIKTEYCKNHNIKLLRISYKENIENKLNEWLKI